VGSLIFAQILAFFLAWIITLGLGLAGFERFAVSWDELAAYRTVRLVVSSIHRDRTGDLVIEPGPDLSAEMIRVPDLKFAAFDQKTKLPLRGSSSELVKSLESLIRVRPAYVRFLMPDDPETTSLGMVEPIWTPFGRLQVAVYKQKFEWQDILLVIREDLLSVVAYILVAMIVSATVTWLAVRRGLAPLRDAAAIVGQIDWKSSNTPQLSAEYPVEVSPFVDAVNEALKRLDTWAASQRRFNANAAHELRTPIAIMRARLENAASSSLRNELLGDTSKFHSIVEQMLVVARLMDGPDVKTKLDLTEVVGSVVSQMLPLALERNCYIDFESYEEEVPIQANRRAVECVVTNLIDNALRVETQQGVVCVRVDAEAVVAVIDHGVGIEKADREMIFEPFWRKNETPSGTGLGLAIAKEIMDVHGGRIWVEDTPGGGATFKLKFTSAPAKADLSRGMPPAK
jgi:signal transduction histidine kinase